LLRNKDVVPALRKALTEIFQKFAKNPDGTMSKENMANYIIACGAGEGSAGPTRISQIFQKHGMTRVSNLQMRLLFFCYPSRHFP
jgi:Ca2+-binding EF-hand superfamily protein